MMTQSHFEADEAPRALEPECPSPCRKGSFSQFLYNTLTNVTYNIMHNNIFNVPYIHREIIHLGPDSEPVQFLGRTFLPGEEERFQREFQNTNWFCYRKNIRGIGDDSGWGCMIRGAQMLLAHVLRKTLDLDSTEVIEYFKEQQQAAFSLTNICAQGHIKRRWCGSSEIVWICKEIAEANPEIGLSIITNNVGVVEETLIKNHFQESTGALLLSFHCQLGIEAIEDTVLPYLKSLMAFGEFCGCLGGTSGNALYLLGCQNDIIICLDPHYVHETEGGIETYFKTHPRGIHYSKLVGSVCINFLVKTESQGSDFVMKLSELNQKYRGINVLSLKCSKPSAPVVSVDCGSESDDSDEDYQLICNEL